MTRSIEVAAPIKDGGRTVGKVVVVHRADGLGTDIFSALAGVLGIAAAALLLALWGARRLQQAMTRPLADLTASVAAITDKADFSRRVAAQSQDEVGDLVGGFNAMLDAIAVRDRKIEAQVKGPGIRGRRPHRRLCHGARTTPWPPTPPSPTSSPP
ncbi:MAG: HAMP domain-containing protein [Asticcacaulis sp.]